MQLERARWRAVVDAVQLGHRRYRIVRPIRPISGAILYETGWHALDMEVDQVSAVALAMAWGLAARSPHTLVYLPLRRSRRDADRSEQLLDLVLLHHSLAFAPARWKQVRQRLSAGVPLRVTLPASTFDRRPREEHRAWIHREFHDHLRWDVAADTLFLTGSRRAFELEADQVRGLAEDAAGYVAAHEGGHYCAEINVGRSRRSGHQDQRRPCSLLHVLYKP